MKPEPVKLLFGVTRVCCLFSIIQIDAVCFPALLRASYQTVTHTCWSVQNARHLRR